MAAGAGDDRAVGSEIRRAVLQKSLFHPLTVLPTGLAAVTAAGGLVTATPVFLGMSLILASMSIGSFAVNYFFRAETFARRYTEALRRREEAVRGERIAALRRELVALSFQRGVEEYDELCEVYERFKRALDKREADGLHLSAIDMREKADATFEEGLRHLRALVETVRVRHELDASKLQVQAQELEQRLRRLPAGGKDPDIERLRAPIQEQLESIRGGLRQDKELHIRIEQLLANKEKCEALLERGSIVVAQMSDAGVRFVQGSAAGSFEDALDVADRYRKSLEPQDDAADRIYDRDAHTEAEEQGAGPSTRRRDREKE